MIETRGPPFERLTSFALRKGSENLVYDIKNILNKIKLCKEAI